MQDFNVECKHWTLFHRSYVSMSDKILTRNYFKVFNRDYFAFDC